MSETLNIADLIPDPENAKDHPERNLAQIEESIRRYGPARSIVIDEHGVILAGNATAQAALRAGITKVRVIESDGTKIVAVQVSGLTPEQKAGLGVADNRAGELGTWSPTQVRALVDAGFTLSDYFAPHELGHLLKMDQPELGDDAPPDGEPGNSGSGSGDEATYGAASWTNAASLRFGRWILRLTPDQADRLRAVLEAWGEDLAALGAAVEAKCGS